jgi:Mrp family chromosome partitioning ATPase
VSDERLSKFEAWIKSYTALKLAIQLANRGAETKVSLGMIYAWIRGEHEPRLAKRRALIQIAAGELTLEDIDAHFAAKKK